MERGDVRSDVFVVWLADAAQISVTKCRPKDEGTRLVWFHFKVFRSAPKSWGEITQSSSERNKQTHTHTRARAHTHTHTHTHAHTHTHRDRQHTHTHTEITERECCVMCVSV